MITLKLRYKTDEQNYSVIAEYQRQYNTLLRLLYNRRKDGVSETACKHLKFNNIPLMRSWFYQSAVKEASALLKNSEQRGENVVFGGKSLHQQRTKRLISKDEFRERRLVPLCSIGSKQFFGNIAFRLLPDLHTVEFRPTLKTRFELRLFGIGKRGKMLEKLFSLQQKQQIPITYKLDKKHVFISFEEDVLCEAKYRPIKNRVFAVDLNPNFIGWSVVDWISEDKYEIVDKGVLSLKPLNALNARYKRLKLTSTSKERRYLSNKRRFETLECAKFLVKKASHYQCESFGIEKLDMKSNDKWKGKKYNQLINNSWLRNTIYNNLKKRCILYGVKFTPVYPQFSSIIGNILFWKEQLPDMILASLEIGRRSYEFNAQYVRQDKPRSGNVIYPNITNFVRNSVATAMEALNCVVKFVSWKQLSQFLKESEIRYRFPSPSYFDEVLKPKHYKFVNFTL